MSQACALQAVFDNVAGARAAAEAKCARAKQRADSAAEVVAQLTVTLDKACGRLQWKAGDLEAGEGVVKTKGAPGAGARGSAAGVPAAATEGFDAARQRRMDAYEEEFRRLRVEIADLCVSRTPPHTHVPLQMQSPPSLNCFQHLRPLLSTTH